MSYTLDIGVDVQEQIAALPSAALTVLAEALVVLEITPWSGPSLHAGNPTAPLQPAVWQLGMVTYLILEDRHEVQLLIVTWAG